MTVTYDDLPNWRDASAYPSEGAYSATEWAWEFLRRTDSYREDWLTINKRIIDRAHYLQLFSSYIKNQIKYGGVAAALQAALDDVSALKNNIKSEADVEQWEAAREILQEGFLLAHKWHLPVLFDPRMAANGRVTFTASQIIASETGSQRKERVELNRLLQELRGQYDREINIDTSDFSSENPWAQQPFQLHIVVDMRVPIGVVKKKLLEEIDRRYAEAKDAGITGIVNRNRDDKYRSYLRSLDADRAGATIDEIGAALFPGQHANDISALRKQVSKTLSSAREQQNNYWKLSLL